MKDWKNKNVRRTLGKGKCHNLTLSNWVMLALSCFWTVLKMKVWESRIRLQDNQSSSIPKFEKVGKAVGNDHLLMTVVFQSVTAISLVSCPLFVLAGGKQDICHRASHGAVTIMVIHGPQQLPGAAQYLCCCSISELPVAFGVLSTWRSSCQSFFMSGNGALAVLAADSLQKWVPFCVASPPLPEFSVKQDSSPMCCKAEIFNCGVFNFSNDCCHSISQYPVLVELCWWIWAFLLKKEQAKYFSYPLLLN